MSVIATVGTRVGGRRVVSILFHCVTDNEYMEKYGPNPTTAASTSKLSIPNTTGAPAPSVYWWEDSWILNVPEYQSNSIAEMYLASISFSLATITGGNIDILPVCVRVCVRACLFVSLYIIYVVCICILYV